MVNALNEALSKKLSSAVVERCCGRSTTALGGLGGAHDGYRRVETCAARATDKVHARETGVVGPRSRWWAGEADGDTTDGE